MRLSCQKVFALTLALTVGCHDSTAPLVLPAQFELENINGRQLPTYFFATPGLTATILSAGLTLDNAGKAIMTEHRREFDGEETTYTNTFDYRIKDSTIEIGHFEPCPPNANCVGIRAGKISGGALTLLMQTTNLGAIIYTYRIVPTG
jgi:hypothetical protein